MERTFPVLVIIGISLLIFAQSAGAQDEQWLQYHCQREAQQIIGSMGVTVPAITTQQPQGVELPKLESEQPYFAQ